MNFQCKEMWRHTKKEIEYDSFVKYKSRIYFNYYPHPYCSFEKTNWPKNKNKMAYNSIKKINFHIELSQRPDTDYEEFVIEFIIIWCPNSLNFFSLYYKRRLLYQALFISCETCLIFFLQAINLNPSEDYKDDVMEI